MSDAQPTIPLDLAGLKTRAGEIITDLLFENAQARGIAMAAQQALAAQEKGDQTTNAEKDAHIADLQRAHAQAEQEVVKMSARIAELEAELERLKVERR